MPRRSGALCTPGRDRDHASLRDPPALLRDGLADHGSPLPSPFEVDLRRDETIEASLVETPREFAPAAP